MSRWRRISSLAFISILLSACAPVDAAPRQTENLDETVLDDLQSVINKPPGIIQFKEIQNPRRVRDYGPKLPNLSDECNALVEVFSAGHAAVFGTAGIEKGLPAFYHQVTSAAGLEYYLGNGVYDIDSPGAEEEVFQLSEAGVEVARSDIHLGWLYFSSTLNAERFFNDLKQWQASCGEMRHEFSGELDGAYWVYKTEWLSTSFSEIEDANGFGWDVTNNQESRYGDGRPSGFSHFYSAFVIVERNVVVIATHRTTEDLDAVHGTDLDSVWEGTWDLAKQSTVYLRSQ